MPEYKVKIAGSGAEKTMHSLDELRYILKKGIITPEDYIYDSNTKEWIHVGEMEELDDIVDGFSPVDKIMSYTTSSHKVNRVIIASASIASLMAGITLLFLPFTIIEDNEPGLLISLALLGLAFLIGGIFGLKLLRKKRGNRN